MNENELGLVDVAAFLFNELEEDVEEADELIDGMFEYVSMLFIDRLTCLFDPGLSK